MMDIVEKVAAIVHLNQGKIVGKTRLQKIFYLLEAKGVGFGLEFDYQNFGPFSIDLAFAVDDAEGFGFIKSEERPGFHAVPYTIFEALEHCPFFRKKDSFFEARRKALEKMEHHSSLVLELAATAVYLRENGYRDNFWGEVKRRKQLKATSDRVQKAKELLAALDLV